MRANVAFGKWCAVLAGLLGLAGCSGTSADRPLAPTEERLSRLGKAYLHACHRLGRAPRNAAELKPDLEGDVPGDFFRSPNDGEEFVILWGVDFTQLLPGRDDPFTVGAYEKQGVNGKRYVLRFPVGVVQMTEEELRKAVFPPGHKPPS
jgi:hypothetical protein